ncbi:MAG: hypothetical protein REI45_04020 [Propionicimonas sp.]|nr:hypothetical protein [Propionicimonas sp.]
MVRQRARWLGAPWFLAAVVVLAVNDHLLKALWPGVVTGKLSDFAGVVVVGTLFSVGFGRTLGCVLAGAGFTGLKVVPGVAELVAPLLGGGITVRDATDLVALVVLPVLWLGLGRGETAERGSGARGWQLVGLIAAVLATTATSMPPDSVDHVAYVDGAFFAEVYLADDQSTRWMSSTDGGATWTSADPPSATPKGIEVEEGRRGPRLPGTTEAWISGWKACANDGVCYRSLTISTPAPDEVSELNNEITYRIDRVDPGGAPVVEADTEGWGKVAVNPTDSRQAVVAATWTIYYRTGEGDWREVDLIEQAK